MVGYVQRGLAAVFVAALLILPSASLTSADDPSEAAIRFVTETGLRDNFPLMLARFGASTQTIQGLQARYGPQVVGAIFRREVEKIEPTLGRQWTKNLAVIYGDEFTVDEMRSLMEDRERSPYLGRLQAFRDEAGARMKAVSETLMKDALTAVISATRAYFAQREQSQ